MRSVTLPAAEALDELDPPLEKSAFVWISSESFPAARRTYLAMSSESRSEVQTFYFTRMVQIRVFLVDSSYI